MTKSKLRVKRLYVYQALNPTLTNNKNELGNTVNKSQQFPKPLLQFVSFFVPQMAEMGK